VVEEERGMGVRVVVVVGSSERCELGCCGEDVSTSRMKECGGDRVVSTGACCYYYWLEVVGGVESKGGSGMG